MSRSIKKLVKKLSIDLLSAIFVLVISGFFNLQPIQIPLANAQAAPCNNITYAVNKTMTDAFLTPAGQLREAGVSDAGQLHTTIPAGYAACLETTPRVRGAQPNALQFTGWMWNTTLGYVSMGCDGTNKNINCGPVVYGAYTVQNLNGNSPVRGYIFNENAGYISMGCDNGLNGTYACQGVYGVQVARAGAVDPSGICPNLQAGDLFGTGWSDQMGWINFCGAHATMPVPAAPPPPAPAPVPAPVPVPVNQVANPMDSITGEITFADSVTPAARRTAAQPSPNTIYANGANYHEVTLAIKDTTRPAASQLILNNDATYRVTIHDPTLPGDVHHITNTVVADQVNGSNCGGCDPQVGDPTPARFGQFLPMVGRGYVMRITSVAPTGGTNVAAFNGVQVDVRKRADNSLVGTIDLNGAAAAQSFTFTPPVVVTGIQSTDNVAQGDHIRVTTNQSENVRVTANTTNPPIALAANQIKVVTQAYSCSTTYDVLFDDEGNNTVTQADGTTPENTAETLPQYPEKQGICAQNQHYYDVSRQTLNQFIDNNSAHLFVFARQAQNAQANIVETTDAVALQTIVEYSINGFTVRYFSRAVTDGSIVNQAATVQGNVNIDVLDVNGLPQGDRIGQSIGERAQSKRETYYRVVTQMLRDATPMQADHGVRQLSSADLNVNQNIFYFRPEHSLFGGDRPCMIFLQNNDMTDIALTGQKTIVAQGCDVYISSNIISPQGDLGIILLEDLSLDGDRKGGNVYIQSNVTDVQSHFVLDGSLFSYVNLLFTPTGLPILPADSRFQLRNQLAIMGSIISNNTYGGCMKAQPLNGDGSIALTPTEKAESCLYDLNFMRYARTTTGTFPRNEVYACWADDVKLSKFITPANLQGQPNSSIAVCRANSAGMLRPRQADGKSITTIIYREPSKLLPIFSGVK